MKYCDRVPDAGALLFVVELESTRGLFIVQRHLEVRRAGEFVLMRGWVPGHGGDVWWCDHRNGDVAAYSYCELEFSDGFAFTDRTSAGVGFPIWSKLGVEK